MRFSIKYIAIHITVCVLLFTPLLPFIGYAHGVNADNQSLGSRILICTIYGPQWVDISTKDEQQQPNIPGKYHCPLCVLHSGDNDTYLPTNSMVNILQPISVKLHYIVSGHITIADVTYHQAHPRAPPVYT